MKPALRLTMAVISGLAGLYAILLVLQPAIVGSPQAWLLGSISLLIATNLVATVTDAVVQHQASLAGAGPPPATSADREVHGEVAKIVGLLQKQVDANATFSVALSKAKEQLPDALKPDQVRLVVSYLMIENENMRSRTAELQGNLEKSQRQIERLKSNLAAAEAQGLSDPLTGLKNRRSFDITLAAEIAAARTSSKPMCLIIVLGRTQPADVVGRIPGSDVIPNFEKATGIKVNQTPFSQNEEQINKLQATGGEGFDLCQPTVNRAPQYKDLAVTGAIRHQQAQEPGNVIPSMMASAEDLWTWEDGLYYLPHCWGSEALSYPHRPVSRAM
jgi:hypothetical protein